MARTHAQSLKGWKERLTALEVNKEEVQHLESRREKLQSIHDGAITAIRDQAAATAAKQDASRRLEALIKEGRKVDAFLTACLREHYGDRSEKLEEYKVKPFRGRRAKKEKKQDKKAEKAAEPQSPPAETGN